MRGWRWWVGRAGRVLIALGLLVLAFAAYQLWGTGIEAARAQDDLSHQFNKAMAATTTTPPTSTPTTSTGSATTAPTVPPTAPPATAPPPPAEGNGLARIEIPRIGVDKIVVEGVGVDDLRKGPGHYPGTALPGVRGNAAIAGHRTTYGAPFGDVDKLRPGDQVILTTITGRYVYLVTGTQIVSPSDTGVLAPSDDAILTLTSCHPKYSASQRIIVSAAFDQSQSSPLLEPTATEGGQPPTTPATLPGNDSVVAPATSAAGAGSPTSAATPTAVGSPTSAGAATSTATATSEDPTVTSAAVAGSSSFQQGWWSDTNAWVHLALWGTLLSLIGIGAWLLGKRIPQWAAALLCALPFLVALYFFFDSLNRLLPANL